MILKIEHHLFPSVHFSHYFALAKITRQTCKEFNIPYNHSGTFWDALVQHHQWLRKMGASDKPAIGN
jgi:linoleoyl-CoA desaturase